MVGLVIVSHSQKLAEGVKELAKQMAPDVPVAKPAPFEDRRREARSRCEHDELRPDFEPAVAPAELVDEAAAHTRGAPAARHHAPDARVGEKPRAGCERARDLGDEHRLLGAGRAAVGAVVEPDATVDVARIVFDLPAEPASALDEELVVVDGKVIFKPGISRFFATPV